MAEQSVKVWVKKRLRLDLLTFRQAEMFQIGQSAIFSVTERLRKAQGPHDGPAKPLRLSYAKWKTRKGHGNKRDLFLTGAMLGNLKVRTVTNNSVKAGLSTRLERIKGRANQKREPWLVFSLKNQQDVKGVAQEVLIEKGKALAVSSPGQDMLTQSFGRSYG